ncbi:MAG: lipopolysaccharide biosynthesis protein [Breznakia sp.]
MGKLKKYIDKYVLMPIEVKASLWYTMMSIIQRGMAFITIPIFARLMTTSQYGDYSVYTAWLAFVMIFTTLNLQYGSFNTAMAKFENDRDGYISSIQGLILVLTAVGLCFFLPIPNIWSKVMELPAIIIFIMFFEIMGQAFLAFWSSKERYAFRYRNMVIITLALTLVSSIVGLIMVVYSQDKGYARIASNALVYVAFGGFFFFFNWIKGKKLFSKTYWLYALKFNIPLIAYYLSQMIFNISDRLMISRMSGKSSAAIYGIAYQFGIVLTFVINAINNSNVPWSYRKIKENNILPLRKVANMLTIFIASLLLLLIFFGPEAIAFLGGAAYVEAIWIVPPIAASMLFLYLSQLSVNIIFYFEQKSYLVRSSAIAAIINVVFNYIGISMFGYLAAGYVTLLSYIIFTIMNFYYMEKVCRDKIETYQANSLYDIQSLAQITLVFLMACAFCLFLYTNTLLRYTVLTLGFIIVVIFRKKIFEVVNFIKKMK